MLSLLSHNLKKSFDKHIWFAKNMINFLEVKTWYKTSAKTSHIFAHYN